MKNILLLTTTPTAGGNGDALIAAAKEEAEKNGAEIHLVNIREKQIGFCRACYGCAETGVCVQKDDFMDILHLAHEADVIIAEAPVYYIHHKSKHPSDGSATHSSRKKRNEGQASSPRSSSDSRSHRYTICLSVQR